jgi:tetratricopeptide (TPR) repeat protein
MYREHLLRGFEHQNFVLLVIGLLMAGLFAVTTFASRAYHSQEEALGKQWFSLGETELQRGNATPAVQAFRNALSYNDVAEYRRRLAAALAQSGDTEEAREYLLNLWEAEPGDGTLNLQLARLAARSGNTENAFRYYQSAIYGVWPNDAENRRREVRVELAKFLLANHRQQAAQADLIALAADLPADPDLYTTVGRLFLDANDPTNALSQFRLALRLNHDLGLALFGAGQAAYDTGDHRMAARYLEQAAKVQFLDVALREIGDTPMLPVVHRADFSRLEGVISLADTLAAYRRAGRKESETAENEATETI